MSRLGLNRRVPGMPRLGGGGRSRLLANLVANALAQSALAVAIALTTRHVLASARDSGVDMLAIAVLIVMGLGHYGLRILEAGTAEALGQRYVAAVRIRMLRRLTAPVDGRDKPAFSFGSTMTRLTGDLNSLRNWIATGIARGGVAALGLLVLTATCLYIEPAGGMTLLIWSAGVIVISAVLASPLSSRVRSSREQRGRLASRVGRLLLDTRDARPALDPMDELPAIRLRSRRLREALVRRTRLAQSIRMLPAATLPIAFAILITTSASHIAPGDLVVLLLVFTLASGMLGQITRAFDYRVNFSEGSRRIGAILSPPDTAASTAGRTTTPATSTLPGNVQSLVART